MDFAITIEKVCKSFGESTVLSDINIGFEKGKIHGLIGRNGSGKTVLMKCICGFIPISSGTITINGKKMNKVFDTPENMGIIIETPGFLPSYNAYKNLKYLADINGKIRKDRILESIAQVGLDPFNKKAVGKYSLGMRQRLGLAQAIMENPDILILDEPMNGLDKDGVEDMRRYLLDLKEQGKTIIIASHSAEDIDILCDTVCEMDKGILKKVKGF
ncbi:MAG: ATP-binding cassette domain-containing protein [Oscillospiraceae bacterium]|nr:ATP-binding cassette domain-containing protein [Oscillospiraceae bacterium]